MKWFDVLTDDRFRYNLMLSKWVKVSHNLKKNNYIRLRQDWAKKGWIKSFDYLASKRAEAKGENVVFRDLYFGEENVIFPKTENTVDQINKRKSVRHFSNDKIPKESIDTMIEVCRPFVAKLEYFEIYFFSFNTEGLENGVYKVNFKKLSITKLDFNDYNRKSVCNLIAGMPASMTSALTVFITCDFKVAMDDIHETACLRRVFVESGMLMQRLINGFNLYNIFGVPSPALSDTDVKNILIDTENKYNWPIYSCALGFKK